MSKENWEELYKLAAAEADGKKVPERVSAVRDAIRGRLQDLEQSSDHRAERDQLKATLTHMDVLLAESRDWESDLC